jgi:hypothetical protein
MNFHIFSAYNSEFQETTTLIRKILSDSEICILDKRHRRENWESSNGLFDWLNNLFQPIKKPVRTLSIIQNFCPNVVLKIFNYVPWVGARSRRFRILARKIEFGLFRMRKKIFLWKKRILMNFHIFSAYNSEFQETGIFNPLSMVFLTPYPWYIKPPNHGILTPCLSLD